MAAINDLINQIEDEELKRRITHELDNLLNRKKFGLVFEEHLPECVPLYDMPIRRGIKIAQKGRKLNETYTVEQVEGENVYCTDKNETKLINFLKKDIVPVAEFGEPIYPYIKKIDSIYKTDDKELPTHALIQADNYHALQLLEYLYYGKVDCIYIDPPYNTGARDWKYNNDYVDSGDSYRHSKWLSMMKKRLELAKKLLNPNTGVLIATIDEHEVHHLRCLLEEIFSDYYIQMVTYVSNPTGATQGRFSRIEEYAIYCFAKDAYVASFDDPMIGENDDSKDVRWKSLLRSGTDARREDRKNMFYPVFVDVKKGIVVDAGEPLPFEEQPCFDPQNGYEVAWPIRTDGSLGRWSVGADTFRELINKGYVQLGKYDSKRKTYGITYISSETQRMIDEGTIVITGKDEKTGVVSIEYATSHTQAVRTVWYRTRHNAGVYGTNLLSSILCNKTAFTFPKSLYSTKDAIATIVANNKNALIIDFFAGSGTTLHAVNLLNAEDNGKRQCILVTNNEVSEDEAKQLKIKGLNPGDTEWEKLGIANYVTWPRTKCAINGKDVNGNDLKGNYIGSDIPMANGFNANAVFFKLGFLDKTTVSLGLQFKELLPLLWLKAGGWGKCPDDETVKIESKFDLPPYIILPENKLAVLINEDSFTEFNNLIKNEPLIRTVYIVTDYENGFVAMKKKLNIENVIQLYRDYLDNFRINVARR